MTVAELIEALDAINPEGDKVVLLELIGVGGGGVDGVCLGPFDDVIVFVE